MVGSGWLDQRVKGESVISFLNRRTAAPRGVIDDPQGGFGNEADIGSVPWRLYVRSGRVGVSRVSARMAPEFALSCRYSLRDQHLFRPAVSCGRPVSTLNSAQLSASAVMAGAAEGAPPAGDSDPTEPPRCTSSSERGKTKTCRQSAKPGTSAHPRQPPSRCPPLRQGPASTAGHRC